MDLTRYTCPITKCIFLDPVIASDGHIYERQAILQWIKKTGQSPLTREKMSDELFPVVYFRDELREQLKKYPEYSSSIYRYLNSYDTDEVTDIIERDSYNELFNYVDFSLRDDISITEGTKNKNKTFAYFVFKINNDSKLHQHIIRNSIDLFFDYDVGHKELPIHYICKYCSLDTIQILLDEFDDKLNEQLEFRDDNNQTGLNYIIERHGRNDVLMEKIIKKNFSFCDTLLIKDGISAMHLIFKNASIPFLGLHFKTRNWSLEEVSIVDHNNLNPLHYLCSRGDLNKKLLSEIFNHKILSKTMGEKNDFGWTPAHYIIIYSNFDLIYNLIFELKKYLKPVLIDLQILPERPAEKYYFEIFEIVKLNKKITDKERRKLTSKFR